MPESLEARALALLARREHSRAELQRKLAPHAESAEILAEVLDELVRRRKLSDDRYAEMRVTVRGRRYGNNRLAQELRQSGVEPEAIASALAQGEDEHNRCQSVWQKKFGTLPDSPAERARQQRFLQYRGFSQEAIRRVLQGLNEDGYHE